MPRLKIGWASADVSTDKALNMPGQDNGTYLPTERAVEGRGFGASIYDNLVTPEAGQILVEETLKTLWEMHN